MNLNEIKESITSTEWVKIGSKLNNPQLSIFPDVMKSDLGSLTYETNKKYYFEDNTHDFRIDVVNENGQKRFVVFAKAKTSQKSKSVQPKAGGLESSNNDMTMIIVSIVIVAIAALILSGPILKALFG